MFDYPLIGAVTFHLNGDSSSKLFKFADCVLATFNVKQPSEGMMWIREEAV